MLGLQRYYTEQFKDIDAILDGFESGMKQQLVSGLTNAAKSLWIASMYEERGKTMVVVTHNLFQAQKLQEDLEELIDPEQVFLYPVNDLIASEIATQSPELRSQRIEVLNHLVQGGTGVIVIPVAGLKRFVSPTHIWKAGLIDLQLGKVIDLDALIHTLTAIGYEREAMVAGPGEFSVRGGIIDVFPLTETHPLRIELFDDEVDSIRFFNSDTQRSEDKVDQITIGPAKEILLFPEHMDAAAERLSQALSQTLKKVKDQKVKEALSEQVGYEIEQFKEHQAFQGIAKYTALIYEKETTFLDVVPKDALIVMDEISRVQEMAEQLDREEAEWHIALLQKGEIVNGVSLSLNWHDINEYLQHPVLYLSLFLRQHGHIQPQNLINVTCRSMQNFHGQIHVLKNECERWKKGQYAVVILAANEERAARLENVLADYDIEAHTVEKSTMPTPGANQIVPLRLDGGFELPQQKLVVITEKEVFTNKAPKASRRNKKLSNAERLKNYNELKVGDHVVHVDHGIGKYIGIETLEVNGVHKDYLHILYKGNDKLYVPVESIDQVQKYVSSEGKEPKLYTLGGSEWKRVKSKAKSSVQDIADDLIKLYAEREASVGHTFQKDGPDQHEFEAVFPYQETDDQLQAVEEIKKDMEKSRPMDRLLCGDVGYGKTEVALRAAFKAISEGKQVAFLVPTTILAQQHFETARERFEEFAINIGVLSRFRSRKEQQETIKGLKKGAVDMVIGTHRLLSKDVVFKDLGLLIVDEEQRFGVTHKEKIKKMKANVDVLTLTATPIPRTLHMSMLGVRDLSVIETPPENRFPVQTYVTEYSGTLMREAIERELARGGQVYFLYNRVESIQRMAEQIAALVPDARVAFAHGQMKETELEAAMLDFLEGSYDVLVSTTIIETGVDIPNVNTLIVYDADRMGLSQLYQLRGRVGRSNRVAYAYFTYQRDKVMNEVAEKRLQAIKEFTELGSGFKIAMRDLSIRGAGNLLGAQQHGFIDSVGFDLYSQMLKDAISERQGTTQEKKTPQVAIDIEADAYIPESYIEDSLQKIGMYKKFKSVETAKDIIELQDEMIDRFGDYPQEVDDLFKVAKINVIAHELMIDTVKQKGRQLSLVFSEEGSVSIDRVKLFETVSSIGSGVGLGAEGNKIKLTIKAGRSGLSEQLAYFTEILEKIFNEQYSPAKTG
ncbi:transcription-repair coupling factor [Scopulibacillus darangshiensis]|uniref:Transcription-repair-coupling factor n=1 Tax=Scopulibacillus darangshiensis TaxID=442528 RepID=A0A4R2NM31_9BACL|nr:transcription-repair coupling factor [Scopulibacillus darangshiensis]TCP22542.1 transcription-repair coupling factor [Scopulibacillus darangshiensis]